MTDIPAVRAAVEANVIVIRQGIELLAVLSADRYARRLPVAYNASIGGHLRHIIDHYESFFAALESGDLDYENLACSTEIETDARLAARILGSIADRLLALGEDTESLSLAYRVETSPSRHSSSSVLRELEFLLSHTVHHYALVAVMCRLQHHEPEESFGIAPSTLRYQQTQAICAR